MFPLTLPCSVWRVTGLVWEILKRIMHPNWGIKGSSLPDHSRSTKGRGPAWLSNTPVHHHLLFTPMLTVDGSSSRTSGTATVDDRPVFVSDLSVLWAAVPNNFSLICLQVISASSLTPGTTASVFCCSWQLSSSAVWHWCWYNSCCWRTLTAAAAAAARRALLLVAIAELDHVGKYNRI